MIKSILISVAACFFAALSVVAQAQSDRPLSLPKAPEPVKQSLPFNAQPSNGGVYVPITKSGDVGVSVEPLRNPVSPNDKGGSIGITFKTP